MNPQSSATLIRRHWPVEPDKSLHLYIGSGRCGGCFDAYGLQHQDPAAPAARRISRTALSHADVWHRGRHGLDTMVPLVRLVWSEPPPPPVGYQQTLHPISGTLVTRLDCTDFRYHLTTASHPGEPDVLLIHLAWTGTHRPDLCVEPVAHYDSDYSGTLTARARWTVTGDASALALERGTSCAQVLVHSDGDLVARVDGDRLRIGLNAPSGEGDLVLVLGPSTRGTELDTIRRRLATLSSPDRFASAASAWTARWRTGSPPPAGLPAPLQQLHTRSIYHLLCSYAPDVRCPAPPNGFTGNAWGYHFPQDLAYIHPALLHTGHHDITRAHVEFYRSRLDNQRDITRELYGKPGVCWSWEFPIGPEARLFRPEDGGAPNAFQFEIHNAAYPAKMAVDTARVLNDPAWTRDIAWPIVRDSARFLAGCLEAEIDGTHSSFVSPSMGQDEFGGPDARNYLCALFATEYTLTQAIRLSAEVGASDRETMHWMNILGNGLAYARLLGPGRDFYAANESLPFAPHRQKHPVQLNPLWLLPLDRAPDSPTLAAWRQRRFICCTEREGHRHDGIPTGFYDGWTLFAFLLSGANLGDAAGFAHELSELHPARLVDPEHITLYESSGFWQPYYTTSLGLFLQATTRAVRTGALPA
jgi:hypothetical protein